MFKLKNTYSNYSFFLTALFFYLLSCTSEPKQEAILESPQYLNLNDSAKYVGINTCKQCHFDIYKTFIQTGMGQSFDLASKAKSSATFNTHTVIFDKYTNLYYHPSWNADTLLITEFRLDGKDTVYKRKEQVDYIIGSGQHTNSHIFNTNGYLHQMPMTFYTQKQKWDFPPGFENGMNTRFSRKIGLECLSCHNAYPDFIQGSENKYAAIPNGIDCERCHGPGSIHVAMKQQGISVNTTQEIDYSIVNPAKLPIDLQFDVCQRCHLQGNAVLKEGKSFFDFKPGMHLSDIMTVFLPKYEGADDEFIMASHADRLKQSKCFIKSFKINDDSKSLRPYKNSLTCVTCHNPHVSVKNTETAVFNAACNNCHGETTQVHCSEKMENQKLKNDNCISCHMPKSSSIDIPHVRVTDHYIRPHQETNKSISIAEKEKVKKFIGLFAINEKKPVAKTIAQAYINQLEKFDLTNYWLLDSAKNYLSDANETEILSNFPQLVQLYFLKNDFKKIANYVSIVGQQQILNTFNRISLSNEDAWTLYRIGESIYRLGDALGAYTYFKKASNLAPLNPEFQNKLAVSLIAMNKLEEAQLIYDNTIKENPNFAQAYCNLGYVWLMKGNSSMAELNYNRALELDPDYEQAIINKAGLYVSQKQMAKAKQILQQYLKYHSKSKQVQDLLSKL